MRNVTKIFKGFQLKFVLGNNSSRDNISQFSHATVTFDNQVSPATGPLKIIQTDTGVIASIKAADSSDIEFYADGKEIPVNNVSFHYN